MKKNLPIIVSIVLALTAAMVAYVTLKAASPTVPVVVAAKNYSIGETIAQDGVAVKMLPPSAVPPRAFSSPAQVVGKTVTASPVLAGDVIREEHLFVSGSLVAALASFAPPGWVAVELPQTGTGMLGIRRGDKVDVYTDVPKEGVVPVVKGAVVLATPWTTVGGKEEAKAYVVAVPPDYAKALAEMLILNKKAAIVLVKGGS